VGNRDDIYHIARVLSDRCPLEQNQLNPTALEMHGINKRLVKPACLGPGIL